jgi:hypothetical protein
LPAPPGAPAEGHLAPFTFAGDRIAAIDIVADPADLTRINTVLHGCS